MDEMSIPIVLLLLGVIVWIAFFSPWRRQERQSGLVTTLNTTIEALQNTLASYEENIALREEREKMLRELVSLQSKEVSTV